MTAIAGDDGSFALPGGIRGRRLVAVAVVGFAHDEIPSVPAVLAAIRHDVAH